jgi:hypothetical protein
LLVAVEVLELVVVMTPLIREQTLRLEEQAAVADLGL